MLTRPQVQRYAIQSGLQDIMIAEKEIILTYALQIFAEKGFLNKFAFKGGTCLRKIFLGKQGRFSTDLDFTALEEHTPEDMILEMMVALEEPFHGISFNIDYDGYYETIDGLSWGVNPTYKHAWNSSGQSEIKLQVSRRETPTLSTECLTQCEQSYFTDLPFSPMKIRSLNFEEIIAEKIRACYQRNKARDIYDLSKFSNRPLNHNLIRRLVVLKLWQAKDTFVPDNLMSKFKIGNDFDWDDLRQLVRKNKTIDRKLITTSCIHGYTFLTEMTPDEKLLAADAHQQKYALWNKLRSEIIEPKNLC